MSEQTYNCPECGRTLELLMDEDDDRPVADRWTCIACNIAYPHRRFPLPTGYVKRARDLEQAAQRAKAEADERAAMAAWNRWARREG